MRSPASLLAACALALAPSAAYAATPSKLAYVTGLAGTRPQVHVVNTDGSGAIALGSGVDALISPDGANVAIVTPYTRRGTSLVVRPAAGGAARTLASTGDSIGPLTWSPDGALLAVVINTRRLVVIDVASGARRLVARGSIHGASFSPDGRQIAYARSVLPRLSAHVDSRGSTDLA